MPLHSTGTSGKLYTLVDDPYYSHMVRLKQCSAIGTPIRTLHTFDCVESLRNMHAALSKALIEYAKTHAQTHS